MQRFQRKCYELAKEALKPGARVLEVSCGNAEILRALKAEGYAVCGTNFSRYTSAPDDIEIRTGVDLRRGLPFAEESFHGVILSDVIEHVSDHDTTIREIARVLKTGGVSIILTPNTNRISSRIHFLLTGFLKPKRAFIGFDVPAEKAFAFHNHPPYLPVFLYQMHSHGLQLLRFDCEKIKPKSVLQWPLLAPWIYLSTFITTHGSERHVKKSEKTRKLLFKTLTSFKALCGEAWVTVHAKRGAEAPTEDLTTSLPHWHGGEPPPAARSDDQ